MSSEGPQSVFPAFVPNGRFVLVDEQHNNASLYILTPLSLVYSISVLCLRLFLRWGNLGIDDILISTATITLIGQATAIYLALSNGIGTSFALLDISQIQAGSRDIVAAIIFLFITLALAKSSVIFLLMRLFNLAASRNQRDSKLGVHRIMCLCLVGLTVVWGICSIIAIVVDCNFSDFLNPRLSPRTCPSQDVRFTAVVAVDVATEVLLVLMTILNLLPLQLPADTKLQVALTFAFRLPCAGLSLAYLHYMKNYTRDDSDGMNIIPVLNFMQITLCWSLVSANIPNLKSFVKSFNSGFGMGFEMHTAYQGSSSGRNGRSARYELSNIDNKTTESQSMPECDVQIGVATSTPTPNIRGRNIAEPDGLNTEAKEGSISSTGSQEQIIRKDVRWHITHEDMNISRA